MSNVTLSAATRQNLLSLQDTAALTAKTQNRLSTGLKVASALDNPTNFFTAQALSNRSADLGSLLDGISNGVQTIQAANQGITSIQKLIDSAKSIASQAIASKNSVSSTTAVTAAALPTTSTTTQSIAFTVDGASKTATIPAGTGTSGAYQASDIDGVVAALNAAAGSTVFSNDSGKVKVASTSSNVAIAATPAGLLGFSAAVAGTSNDATRTSLAAQFNTLLTQIDQLAKDASYNGVNLLTGGGSNKLHIAFNEKDTTSLDVQGVDLTSTGLALTAIPTTGANANFQNDTDVKTALSAIGAASERLRAQSSTFGSNLSVVQNRQNFTKNIINILGTGASNLTDADLNEEAANSQALSTRQSLGISALSLANQAQQGILQLLR